MKAQRLNRVDNHSHILRVPILDMAASAQANKVNEFSITEHISQFRELRDSVQFGSKHDTGRIFDSLDEYANEFQSANTGFSNMKINRGLEVDFIPRCEDSIAEFVNRADWDILLCSIHEFEDGEDVETSMGPLRDSELVAQRWNEYFRLELMALVSDSVPFNVLAHPVRMSRGLATPPPNLDDLLMELATTARRRGKSLELNGSDITYAPHLVRRLAVACSNAECPVSLGSDAHYPKDVFQNMSEAMKLVDELKLTMRQRLSPEYLVNDNR